jgi:hypothetical protein
VRLHLIGSAAVVLFSAAFVPAAAQTVYGQGGLLLHPSAFMRPAGSLNFGASYFSQRTGTTGRSEWNPYSLSYAFSGRAEFGVTAIRHQGTGIEAHTHVGPFVRYQFLPDTPSHPAVGLQASDLPSDLRQTTVAGVLSHRFGPARRAALTVHTGLEWVRTSGETGNQSDAAGFVGLQVPLTRELAITGEVGTKLKFERHSASAIGLMWASPAGPSVAIGWVNNGRSRSHEFFIGAGYPIGGLRAHKPE